MVDIVETYSNALYEGHTCHRYWIRKWPVLVGGSVLHSGDWEHLAKDFWITDVVNVETEHDDSGKIPADRLIQARVPDVGSPFPADKILSVCLFVANKLRINDRSRFYVHCQMGGSRSPAFAYAILRGVYGLSQNDALQEIIQSRPEEKLPYGHHDFHKAYLKSIEEALSLVRP